MMLTVPSKKSVQKAGDTLKNQHTSQQDYHAAMLVLSQWRSLHTHPINTFQAALRSKLKRENYSGAIVAQRLKRTPSIIRKLTRFPDMNLARMQDIGGLRVILKSVEQVYRLHASIINNSEHQAELPPKDYIAEPKADGYRSLHQVFRYKSKTHPELDGLRIELQIRTELQHAWATAVETLGIIEKSSFKTGEGEEIYRHFFRLSSKLFAHFEMKEANDIKPIAIELRALQGQLQIFAKLKGLALSAGHINRQSYPNGYFLMLLDTANEPAKIQLLPFSKRDLDLAETAYRLFENEHKDNPNMDIVLLSTNSAKDIKKAYPNYFLDTHRFIERLSYLIKQAID